MGGVFLRRPLLELLLAHGANPRILNAEGASPGVVARQCGFLDAAARLDTSVQQEVYSSLGRFLRKQVDNNPRPGSKKERPAHIVQARRSLPGLGNSVRALLPRASTWQAHPPQLWPALVSQPGRFSHSPRLAPHRHGLQRRFPLWCRMSTTRRNGETWRRAG